MAGYRAIHATCEGVVKLLEQNRQANQFNNAVLEFEVYSTENFANPMSAGVSLFVYHVSINMTQRTLPARPDPITGMTRRRQLPLDLHFMLTPWAKDASLAHEILGWMMRVLEDSPLLSPQMMNSLVGDARFNDEESVEIVAGQMSMEEMFRIWDVLPGDFRLSVPYVARVVRIDSDQLRGSGIVLERDLDFGKVTTS